MDVLTSYLPKDLIKMVNEYDDKGFNDVIIEFNGMLKFLDEAYDKEDLLDVRYVLSEDSRTPVIEVQNFKDCGEKCNLRKCMCSYRNVLEHRNNINRLLNEDKEFYDRYKKNVKGKKLRDRRLIGSEHDCSTHIDINLYTYHLFKYIDKLRTI